MSRRALLLCCLLLPMIPDADVIMHRWVKYGHPLGHRGVSHSVLFALIFGLGLAWLLQRLGRAEQTRKALAGMTLAFTLLMVSHGITDTMTTGGKPPRLLWPVKSEGVWFPKRFIPVSPMGKSLLRTKWTKKQYAHMKRMRARLLRGKQRPFVIVRKVVSWSKRPDHYRRLGLAGIVLTEFALLSPFAMMVIILAIWRRRRFGPSMKAPPRTRPPPEAVPEGPPPHLWPALLASGVALVAVVVVGWLVRAPDAEISITSGELEDELRTHYRHFVPAEGGTDVPVAVLVHGARCSHQMMTSLARTLARNGVEVWAVDMPGHGRSRLALDTGCGGKKRTCRFSNNRVFMDATDTILKHLWETRGYDGPDVVLIGHSTGAVVAHELQGEPADSLGARVVLEGNFRRLRRDGNRLIVGKSRYLDKVDDGLEHDVLYGSFEDGTATELFTANRPHLDMIHDEQVNARILRWIADATGKPVGDAADPLRKLQIAWIIVFALFGLSLAKLGATLASRQGWLPPVRPRGHARPGIAFMCMVFGSVAAALWAGELFRYGEPWLQAMVKQDLPTYLMCAGVTVGVPYVMFTRRPGRPELRSLAVDTAFAVLVFLSIYLTLGLATDRYLFHLGLTPWRWVRALTWAVAFLPIALLVHEIGFQSDRWCARIATVLVHGLVWGALFWVQAVGRSASQLNDAKRWVVVLVLAEAWALCVGWRRRSRFFVAFVTALVLAWVLTAVYPILAGAPVR